MYFVQFVLIRKEVSLTESLTQTNSSRVLLGKAADLLQFTCLYERQAWKMPLLRSVNNGFSGITAVRLKNTVKRSGGRKQMLQVSKFWILIMTIPWTHMSDWHLTLPSASGACVASKWPSGSSEKLSLESQGLSSCSQQNYLKMRLLFI